MLTPHPSPPPQGGRGPKSPPPLRGRARVGGGVRRQPMPLHHRPALLAVALAAAPLAGCESRGHFSVLGYSTRPKYDCNIRTVYVPTFTSQVLIDSTRRTLHLDLTKAVIREIERKTPFKVVSDPAAADTELSGNIFTLTKNLLNRNQLNEIREGELVLTVGIVWKDLRSGEILSLPRPGPTALPTPGIPELGIPELTGAAPPLV